MSKFLDFLWLLLAQFGGGPESSENNLVRFGLAAIFWSVLLVVAWSRQRHHELPREKLLVWGFGLGLTRELFMFGHVSLRMLDVLKHGSTYDIVAEPLEHSLTMAAIVVVAGSFLRYILDDTFLPRRYLQVGLGIAIICFPVILWWWSSYTAANSEVKFHHTWGAWFVHVTASVLIAVAIVLLMRRGGWLRNIVSMALAFFFVSEFLLLVNFATDRTYAYFLCPIGNNFHIWAIPLLGYVYLREQSIEREQAQDAMRESEQRYRGFVQNFDGIAFRKALDLQPVFFHGAVEKVTGYPEERFVEGPLKWNEVIHPDDVHLKVRQVDNVAAAPGYRHELEYRIVREDGEIRWVHENVQNVCDQAGQPSYVQGTVYDVTERVRAEEELKAYRDHLEELVEERTAELMRANEQLQREIAERVQAEKALAQLSRQNELILNSAGEGIFGVNLQGKHTFVNLAAAGMLGYKAEELIGRSSHSTWHHSKPDGSLYPEGECPLHTGYKTGTVLYGDDQVFWRKDGTSFPARYMSTPIYENGKLMGAVVVFRDITARKQAEAEIARRNAELAAQNAISATLSQSLDLDMILNAALDSVLAVLGMGAGCIFLLEPDDKTLTLQTYHGNASPDEAAEYTRQQCLCEDISYQAVDGMEPVILNVSDHPVERRSPFVAEEDLQVLVSTPLVSKGRAVGALTLGARQPGTVLPQEMELLTAIGQQIGMAVENARLYQETEHWAGELALLHEVSVFLSSTLDPEKIYDQITEQAAKLLSCQATSLLRWDEEDQEAVGVSSYGMNKSEGKELRLHSGECDLLPDLIAYRQSIAISDSQTDPRGSFWRERFNAKSLLCVPVWGTERPLAFLFMLDRRQPRQWRPEEMDLVESFVNRAAIALENAYLHKQLEWAAALEERQRIAAEMHDGLAQTLSYLGHRVDQTAELLSAGQVQEVIGECRRIRDTIDRASREVRRSIASLQESPRLRQSLQDQLIEALSEIAIDGGPPVDLVTKLKDPLFLPTDHSEQVLCVVREGLLNAGRHAQAQKIIVRLEKQGDELVITIEDDGQGFDPAAPMADNGDHFGLSIMRARAARIGGCLKIDSAPGQGTRVILTWSLVT